MSKSQDILLREVEAFLVKSGMPATSFGEQLMNDRHLVRRLRAGSEVRLRTADKIREFIANYNQKKAKRREMQPAA